MKNFVKHTLAIAICAAALLSSCIKEQEFIRSTAELSVSLTGIEDTRSDTQGNLIKDAWIFAYQCTLDEETGAPTILDAVTPSGARYVSGLNSYNSISVHVPLPTCSEVNGTPVPQSYLLVAVINTEAFGSLDINANSNWGIVKNATFAQTGAFWGSYPKNNAPEVMPISNWTTLTITNADTHSDNCYALNLPVYRAVAKTQLYMSKAGDFDLQVLDAKVVANKEYSAGMLLTGNANNLDSNGNQLKGDNNEAIQQGLPSEEANPWWWGASPAVKSADKGYQLKNSDSGFTAAEVTTLGSATNPESGEFTWVASTFLLENDNEAAYGVGAHDAPQGDGYNLYVKYQVGEGEPVEVYTPLGKVARNHDYQVKATVDAGGEITLNIEVVDWVEEEIEMNYENTVTIADNGYINWTTLPEKSNSVAELVNGEVASGQIDLTYEDGATAKCTFALQTPQYGTWHAELRTLSGVTGNIVFVDRQSGDVIGTSTKGDISDENGAPQQAELIIKNVGNNLATGGSTGDNVVELRIYATGIAGVYQIPNLPGVFDADGVPEFSYYRLTQPRN